jgi:hypothetical protein
MVHDIVHVFFAAETPAVIDPAVFAARVYDSVAEPKLRGFRRFLWMELRFRTHAQAAWKSHNRQDRPEAIECILVELGIKNGSPGLH